MRLGSLALAMVVAAFGLVGPSCSYRNENINRVVAPYWRKADFAPDTQWYQRTTVVDAPPESPWISIADGDWLMLERIRWEITEDALIGWRDYPMVPGSELDTYPGGDDVYKGAPVAMFRITDHFDVRQDFDPTTGELANTTGENRDRLWHDRAMFRVDWSRNMVPAMKWHVLLHQVFNTTSVVQNDVGDPKRYRFELDDTGRLEYFEVTTRTQAIPDIYTYYGWYGIPYAGDASGAMLDMRHSFMRVPPSDYQPISMPPTVVLEDADGNEQRDAQGNAVRVPINDRFAFFGTLGRLTFDQNRGMVQSGEIHHATRFNIWEKTLDTDGSVIPVDQRTPKPIVYYTNVEHPEALMRGSERVAAGWNKAFREVVWKAQSVANPGKFSGPLDEDGIPSDVPEMFILKRNDCNIDNVERVLGGLPAALRTRVETDAARESYSRDVVAFDGTLADVKERFTRANDPENTASFTARQSEETQALNDLERICAALEYVTQGDPTLGVPAPKHEDGTPIAPFKYQRLGDTRYSMMNLIVGSFQAGWLGLGPPYADPITGETISATANVGIRGLDQYAARAAQFVQIMNGDLDPTSVAYGFDIADYMKDKLLENQALTSLRPDNRAREKIGVYFDALKRRAGGDVRNAIGEVPPGRSDAIMGKVAGTEFEQHLITPDDLIAFGRQDPLAAEQMTPDQALLESVSPVRGNNLLDKFRAREERIVRMGQRAMDPPEMIDNLLIGHAIKHRDLPYDELFAKLREDMYVAVQLHEVGHNVGLFHNMAGSADALNFGKFFWDIHKLDPDMEVAKTELEANTDEVSQSRARDLQACIDLVAAIDDEPAEGEDPRRLDPGARSLTTQECLRQSEAMYSSIMDYHANWNSDFGGLGPYDHAAVKFAYGQLLEVFNDGVLNETEDTRTLKRRIALNGWRNIAEDVTRSDGTVVPAIVKDVDSIYDRSYVKMDWNTSSTRQAPMPNEVPYKFGWGGQFTPDEKPFDFGPDFQSNARNELNRYYQHYFFTHFSRDRLWEFNDGINAALWNDLRSLDDFTAKMKWFFFYEATDPEFRGSPAEDDMLAATITGLNFFGRVLSHPGNGRYVTAMKSDIFGLLNEAPEARDFSPSDIAISWSSLGECSARTVAFTDSEGDGTFVAPREGFRTTFVPPSEGRPFFIGLTDEYEDWYVTYVGTFWTKIYALQLLSENFAWFPRSDADADFRLWDISWYRLFPREVSKIYSAFITGQTQDIGPTIGADSTYVPRDLVNPDLSEPDYSGNVKILPSVSDNQQYYALLFANAFMNSVTDDTADFPKSMRVALEGGNDDMAAFDAAIARAEANGGSAADVVATFTHPLTGLKLRGLKVGEFPVAYDLVNRLNVMRERFTRLQTCVEHFEDGDSTTNAHLEDSYCECTVGIVNPSSGDCESLRNEKVGEGTCHGYSLRNQRDAARERLDDLVDYVNDLRSINKYLGMY